MNEKDIIKMYYPDGYEAEITVGCINNVIRRAKIGKVVEAFGVPTIIIVTGLSIWNYRKNKRKHHKE